MVMGDDPSAASSTSLDAACYGYGHRVAHPPDAASISPALLWMDEGEGLKRITPDPNPVEYVSKKHRE